MAEHDEDRTSFEVDRHVDDAPPPREDLLEPEELELADPDELTEPTGLDELDESDELDALDDPDDLDEIDEIDGVEPLGDPAHVPESEALPESQGDDVVASEHLVEDAGQRPSLHDEPEGE